MISSSVLMEYRQPSPMRKISSWDRQPLKDRLVDFMKRKLLRYTGCM